MGDELEELKHNLKVSFSRMKEDITDNKQKVELLIEINKQLKEQISRLETQIARQPPEAKSELLRQYKKNKKSIIKQRILALVQEHEYPLPDLKYLIVDEKRYCSKATFYRYIDELKNSGSLNIVNVQGNQIVVVA